MAQRLLLAKAASFRDGLLVLYETLEMFQFDCDASYLQEYRTLL